MSGPAAEPLPCCGQAPKVFDMRDQGKDFVVHCTYCWEGTMPHPTREEAIEEWNALFQETAQAAQDLLDAGAALFVDRESLFADSEVGEAAYKAMAMLHPHEAYALDPDLFWKLFQQWCPGKTRENMLQLLKETKPTTTPENSHA